jgi:hypothetical protein
MFSDLVARLLQLRRGLRPQRRPRPIRQRRPLWCEQLEDRMVLSTLTSTPGGSVVLGSGTHLTDSATLSGLVGANPGGKVNFRLFAPDGTTVVYTDNVPVTGNGTYTTAMGDNPGGYVPTAVGTYNWVAVYTGDAANDPAPGPVGPLVIKLPDGTFNITGFDPGPGNLLVTGLAQNGGNLFVGEVLDSYFQANMSAILGTNGLPVPGNTGLNSTYELTVVAHFTEVVTSLTPTNGGLGAIATFGLNPGQTNPFFEIWEHDLSTPADNFNGTGFAVGTKILSGVINKISTSNFAVNNLTVTVPIDNPFDAGGTPAGQAYWNANTTTVQGAGNNNVTLGTLEAGSVVLNPTFFPNNQVITTYTLRPGTGLEFQNVDPSKQFDALPNAGGTIASIPTGIANGTAAGNAASNKQVIEIDDKESFMTATAVNEPETVTQATPTVNTSQTPASGTIGTVLNDDVTIANGFNPTGTLTVKLFAPGNTATPVYTDVITVSGNGTYHTATQGMPSGNNTAQVVGTYQWVATYSGDPSNAGPVSSNLGDEPVTISTVPAGTGSTATLGFWKNKGQALITSTTFGSTDTALGNYLGNTYACLFGNLVGATRTQVAAYVKQLIGAQGLTYNTMAQALANALAVFATTTGLGWSTATGGSASYGFSQGQFGTGTGTSTINVGNCGAAFGVPNGTSITVNQVLTYLNNHCTSNAVGGNPTTLPTFTLYGGDNNLINCANIVCNAINEKGDIH